MCHNILLPSKGSNEWLNIPLTYHAHFLLYDSNLKKLNFITRRNHFMLDLINDMEKCYAVFGLPAATMNGDSHQFLLNIKILLHQFLSFLQCCKT